MAQNFLLLYKILYGIKKGAYPSQIARRLGISKQLINYYLKRFLKGNLIEKEFRTSFTRYKLTEKGQEYLKKLKIKLKRAEKVKESKNLLNTYERNFLQNYRLHNLAIKFPILEENKELSKNLNWDKEIELQNWNTQIKQFIPYGITLKKTTKSIIVYLHQFQTKDFSDFINKILIVNTFVYDFLQKNGIKINIYDGKVISQHIASKIQDNIAETIKQKVGHKATAEVDLNREAKSIYPTEIQAKAWIDYSFGDMEIETNDLTYLENFILMPERVKRFEEMANFIIQQQYEFAKNLQKHIEVLDKIGKGIDALNDGINKLNSELEKLKKESDKNE
jgi:DNA-binding MarR family transcriptional regulator